MKTHAIVLACIFVLCASVAHPINLYVDPVNGDDSNTGRSWQYALKTITRAAEIAGGRSASIHLAEGTFSEASGEVFPIVFERLALLSGQSPEKTIIDAGCSPIILECDAESYEGAMSSLTILRSRTDQVVGDQPGAISLSWLFGEFDQVRFINFNGAPILSRVSIATITDCVFSGDQPDALWEFDWEYQDYPSLVSMSGCAFRYSPSVADIFPAPLLAYSWGLEVRDCTFTSTRNSANIYIQLSDHDSAGSFAFINCSFENINLTLAGIGSSTSMNRFVGCSFRSSSLTHDVSEYCHWFTDAGRCEVTWCVFDADSSFIIETGDLTVYVSCIPFTVELGITDCELTIHGSLIQDPVFAYGPLGDCYLSNVGSGQEVTSPCLDFAVGGGPGAERPPEGTTTRTDGVPDVAPFDIGYHYPSVPPPPPKVSIKTDRTEYAAGEEMQAFMSYENRGVKVEGAIYFAFGPESLEWLIYWPWMTFVPTPWVEGTLWSGVSYPNLAPTTHTIPDSLAPGGYLWLGAVLSSDGSFASDIALWPVTITGD